MWQCPKCETLNKDDQCIVCNERKPIEQTRKVETLPPQMYYRPVQPQNQANSRYSIPENKSSSEKHITFTGIVVFVFLFIFIAVYLFINEYAPDYDSNGVLNSKSVSNYSSTNNASIVTQPSDNYFGRSISTDYLVKTQSGGPVNLRPDPSTTYKALKQIPNSTTLVGQYLSKDELWVYVNYDGTSGWVSKEYLMIYS